MASPGLAVGRDPAGHSRRCAATDDPGRALRSETGAFYDLQSMMCISCIDDVPANAPDTKTTVKADGSFTHP